MHGCAQVSSRALGGFSVNVKITWLVSLFPSASSLAVEHDGVEDPSCVKEARVKSELGWGSQGRLKIVPRDVNRPSAVGYAFTGRFHVRPSQRLRLRDHNPQASIGGRGHQCNQ